MSTPPGDATTQFIHQIQMTKPQNKLLLFSDGITPAIDWIQMTKPQDKLLLFIDDFTQTIHQIHVDHMFSQYQSIIWTNVAYLTELLEINASKIWVKIK